MPQDKPPTRAPATQSAVPESSMQDIIASISRIIAEDSRIPNPALSPSRGKSGILELTDAVEDDGSVRKLSGEPFAPIAADEPSTLTTAVSTAAPPVAETRFGTPAEGARDGLVSAATTEAAVTAFARLGSAAGEQRAAPELGLGTGDRTLEEIVRDVLRPLLQAWLDHHLPGIIERLVQDEIQRLVREARLR